MRNPIYDCEMKITTSEEGKNGKFIIIEIIPKNKKMSGIRRRTKKEESETGKLNSLNLPRSTGMLLLLSQQCKSPSEKHSRNIFHRSFLQNLRNFLEELGFRTLRYLGMQKYWSSVGCAAIIYDFCCKLLC